VKPEAFLIKNVRIFDPTSGVDQIGDLKISAGKIAQIGKDLKADGAEQAIEGKGKVLVPGFLDLHTHLREPGFEHKETIETGTRAAAAGGFTAVCCMANTQPVNDSAAITQYILEQAERHASVRVLPIGAISKGLEGRELAEIGELKAAGCVGVSDDGKTLMDNQLMRLAMDYAKSFDLPVMPHCICAELSEGGSMHEGVVSCRLGLTGIPAEAEEIIVARDIHLSRLTGCSLHVTHVSTAGAVELVRQAKKQGLPVTAEATPHHFTLTDEACSDYNTHAKMCPPLRAERDRQAVIQGILDGTIDAIATDHAPHAVVDKELEFDQAAFGVIGLETAFPLALNLVEQQGLSLARLIQLLTSGPAAVIRQPRPGIAVGGAADLALLDLNARWTYRAAEGFSKSRNTPFEGWEMKGRVVATWMNGKRVHFHE
jgi:dihydroorotase